jgi:hypothetical protein
MASLCASQQATRGVKKTTKKLLKKVRVRSSWPKKLRKTNLFPVVFSLRFLVVVFLAVSLHEDEESKSTTKILSKTRPENLKKNSKKGR